MKKTLVLLLLVLSNITFSQSKEGMEICLAMQSNNFMSDTEAENALDKILDVIGASKNFILLPCDKINNAVATAYKGYRYILYDKQFMQQISYRTNDWSNLAILAHEVGHHINGHSLDVLLYAGGAVESKSLEQKRQQELEADEFAGFILAKLGATMSNALSFTNIFSDKDDTYSTHPTKYKRVAAVKKGYSKGIGGKATRSNDIPKEYTKNYSIKYSVRNPKRLNLNELSETETYRVGNTYNVNTNVYLHKKVTYKSKDTGNYLTGFSRTETILKKGDTVIIVGDSMRGYIEVMYKGQTGYAYLLALSY